MLNKTLDKVSLGGVWLATLSCTACFPALGALASTLGLGFLSTYEGIAVNSLLPLFATLALVVNIYGWVQHHNHSRGALSIAGPTLILLTLYPLWQYSWSTYLFYAGLGIMVVTSIFDIVKPTTRQICKT
ncbi:organomercurial transporter MerC [Psychrosphaera sp. 1_MG-2023]|uniref:organomercurial transporter MerC n=1 Tax=Psychrosphaera sp. 1_MG-2023 TaxID=3062643 RepID=UPI0026E40D2A|nr:organomercurial transporter MerC [Psychrosphaera sp. 1_MG-2023]MDO6721366.1 organomercurial transporter MerC [Psychrosphaera sp. 1_MG-2023]